MSHCSFVLPTGSMEDTILIGDHLYVNYAAYGIPAKGRGVFRTQPQRGDIIIFLYPVDPKQTFVKRVIGIPRDRIRLENKVVYLNGKALREPYAYHKTEYIDSYRDNFPADPNVHVGETAVDMLTNHVANGEVVVPSDCFFAMGDNRDSSLDSRYWGFVPRDNILGEPLMIYWSYDAPTESLADPQDSLDHIVDVIQHLFTKTRWARCFRLIHGYPLKSE
jgi:signal peptidase I